MEQPGEDPQKPESLAYANRQNAATAGPAPDIWVAAIVGVIVLLMSGDFPGWLLSSMVGRTYETGVVWNVGPHAGEKVAYWDIKGYLALSQSAVFGFGVALLVEAGAMFLVYKAPALARKAIGTALFITILATLYNVYAMIVLFGDGQKPIVSLLAVAFGGYMVLSQWRILRPAIGAPK